jgi:hypothetical protein
MKWHPIATAPRDGTRVLIFSPSHGVCSSYLVYGYWQNLPCLFMQDEPTAADPTHWMPLPEPPQ